MPDEARLILAFGLALAAAFAATPVAIAIANRTGFQDKPVGYKGHMGPTPYLGGAAVVAAFVLAGLTVGGELSRLSPIVGCAFAMWCLGTLDDRVALSPTIRLTVEFAAASTLWAVGLGWSLLDVAPLDLLLTNLWVVGLVNAFNLMDNMDGVAATVGGVTAAVTAVLALVEGDVALAVLCAGMSGACLGFLPYNLAGPARIFLGDGGSLPIGFVVAAAIMALPDASELGSTQILAAVMLAGVPVVDTALVMISRKRARIPLLTGGRDHVTHRLATRLGQPRRVAIVLGTIQAVLGAAVVGVVQLGEGLVVSAWETWFVAATAAVVLLESARWAPVREPRPDPEKAAGTPSHPGVAAAQLPEAGRSLTLVEGALIVFITVACGLSPALNGFYSVSVWGPIALFLLAALLGLVLARPAAVRPAALAAVGGLTFLWLWSLLSAGWSESADQALTESNRWMLYATLFAALVLVLRDDRLGRLLLGSATAAVLVFGGYLAVRLLGSEGNTLFLSNRLHEPLGYVNGQAGYLLLGLWPLVAVAERARNHALAGAAIAAAVLLAGLAILGQTRAIVPAVIGSALVIVAVLPGRRPRLWALIVVGAGVALAAPQLLEVFESARGSRPDPDTVRSGVASLLAIAAVTGVVFAVARWLAGTAELRVGARSLAIASTVALIAIVGAGAVAGLAAVGDPVERVRDEARAFRSLGAGSAAQESRSRFTSGGGNRYDYWRVAANQFRDEPLKGIGAGNYDRTYFLERETSEDIKQPHSLPLQTVSELGLIGGAGLALFLGAILAGFVRRARAARTSPSDLGLAVAGGGMFLVWLVHTSVDWLHLIPGVTGIALCGAAVLVAPWARERAAPGHSRLRLAAMVLCALVVLFGATMVGRSALADKYRSDAQNIVATDPREALDKTADSLTLNDESLPAYYVQAAAHARLGSYELARASLLEATRREPHDFVPWGLLGDLAVRRGDFAQARRDYGRASELNPRDTGLEQLAASPRSALQR